MRTKMSTPSCLSDFNDPVVKNKAADLTLGKESPLEKIESIFYFVRDGIKFGFTPKWDEVKASEVLRYGLGYCNTKATLFVALCRACGVSARVHFGLIDIRIMHGILPAFAFPLMPKVGGHSWTEVEVEGQWQPIDSYINDERFYHYAVERLKLSGLPMGYSVSFIQGKSCCEFNFGEKGFVHMGAVIEDHSTWDDPAEYFHSVKYPRFNAVQMMGYPLLARLSNRNIEGIRKAAI
jgi:hypothetical protein